MEMKILCLFVCYIDASWLSIVVFHYYSVTIVSFKILDLAMKIAIDAGMAIKISKDR